MQYVRLGSSGLRVSRVSGVAARLDVFSAQVALAWLLSKPGVTAPIVDASKLPQLDEAIAAIDLVLSPDDVRLLEEPYTPHSILGLS